MILDGLIAILLFITIVYSWKLSKKVSILNASRKELQGIIAEFDHAITKADTSVASLKTLSQETDEQLQKHIEKARFLTNDLAFLTHKGDGIADRLEGYVSSPRLASTYKTSTRLIGKPNTSPRDPSVSTGSFTKKKQKEAESNRRDIQSKNLGWRQVERTPATVKPLKEDIKSVANNASERISTSKRQALEEVLEQIAARKKDLPEEEIEENVQSIEHQTSINQDT